MKFPLALVFSVLFLGVASAALLSSSSYSNDVGVGSGGFASSASYASAVSVGSASGSASSASYGLDAGLVVFPTPPSPIVPSSSPSEDDGAAGSSAGGGGDKTTGGKKPLAPQNDFPLHVVPPELQDFSLSSSEGLEASLLLVNRAPSRLTVSLSVLGNLSGVVGVPEFVILSETQSRFVLFEVFDGVAPGEYEGSILVESSRGSYSFPVSVSVDEQGGDGRIDSVLPPSPVPTRRYVLVALSSEQGQRSFFIAKQALRDFRFPWIDSLL